MRDPYDNPPTLDEYREWSKTATRNYCDDPIGEHTVSRRQNDKQASKVAAQHADIVAAVARGGSHR